LEHEINQRVADAVSKRATEYEARLKEVEEAAREREKVQAAMHAQKLQKVEDDLKQVQAEFKQVQAELNTWKLRAYALVAILTVSVLCIGILLFKLAASPIVLGAYAILFVAGLVLLRMFFPEIFLAVLKFLWWMLQNPFWGSLILALFFALFYFRQKIFNKVFGPTQEDTAAKIASLESQIAEKDKVIASLRSAGTGAALAVTSNAAPVIAASPPNGGNVPKENVLADNSKKILPPMPTSNYIAPAAPPLPHGWTCYQDPMSGRLVYVDYTTSPPISHDEPPTVSSSGKFLFVSAPTASEDAADAADCADSDEKMLSNTPPPRPATTTLPAHTPIRDISSP
jgi:hypothetical protein